MAALSEQTILNLVYSLYEGDADNWVETSDEYLAARQYAKLAIGKWEHYDNTTWRDLFTTLTAAADGDKTITAGDYTYSCPTNFVRVTSFVRTVIQPENVAKYAGAGSKYCYFTGSVKDGFTLNFNTQETLTTGDTINYEYYKQATLFTAITSTTEMADPYFIVYFILARLLKNDGEDNSEELQEADDRLETMRVANMSGQFGVENIIEDTRPDGFGL
jgi:hypothetical protein